MRRLSWSTIRGFILRRTTIAVRRTRACGAAQKAPIPNPEGRTAMAKEKHVAEAIDLVGRARKLSSENEKYYKVWEFFSGRVDNLKGRLWTTMTWLISSQIIFISYLDSKEDFIIEDNGVFIENDLIMIAFSICGILFCIYSFVSVYFHADHLYRAYEQQAEALRHSHSASNTDKIEHGIANFDQDSFFKRLKTEFSHGTLLAYIVFIILLLGYVILICLSLFNLASK
jgi:hypothetical protein